MISPNYPSSGNLIVTFLDNVRRYRINSVRGINPTLINVNGELMYIYIKNLSPAQLSNDNPDIWRIQLPKRKEFEEIKSSDHMFLLFGYDYIRKVYTTWNPYWCKQRLNVAESCSMYSRLSLQERVASTQKIEKLQLQNDGDVLCIPALLLASYLKNIYYYYPKASTYVPVGSSIQKRIQTEQKLDVDESKEQLLFNQFLGCFKASEFRSYLQDRGYTKATVLNYVNKLEYILENGYIERHKILFLEYSKLEQYKRSINRFCWQPDITSMGDVWQKAIISSLKLYLIFVEKKLYGTNNIRIKHLDEDSETKSVLDEQGKKRSENSPWYVLDDFGKLIVLDAVIVDRLAPKVRGVDYPDYGSIIKEIKEYYPPQATEKMTPADWFKLFDSTKWRRIRGRKVQTNDCNTDLNSQKSENTLEVSNPQKENRENNADTFENVELNLDVDKLNTVFDKRVTSYKYFWLIAIISIAKEKGALSISFDDIVIRMATIAWPIVMSDGIYFGERDMMSKYLKDIQKKTYLISTASSKIVEASLSDYYKVLSINRILSPLLANVPYRFLSPWVKFSSNEDVIKTSNQATFDGLYSINANGIIVNPKWWNYIKSNYNKVSTFILNSLIIYLKQYNSDFKLLRLKSQGWSFDSQ